MIIHLTLDFVLALQEETIRLHGGDPGILNLVRVESALAQPQLTFGGEDLYPTVVDKGAALGFFLASGHGFVDGNKRVGFAAMDVFLRANGYKVRATPDDAEAICLGVASHTVSREQFTEWVRSHVEPLPSPTP